MGGGGGAWVDLAQTKYYDLKRKVFCWPKRKGGKRSGWWWWCLGGKVNVWRQDMITAVQPCVSIMSHLDDDDDDDYDDDHDDGDDDNV